MINQAILNLNPDLRFTVNGDLNNENDYNNIIWYNDVDENNNAIEGEPDNKPTWADVEVELSRLQSEYTSQNYSRKRKKEYPDMGDQFDMLWHAIDGGTLDKTSDFYTSLKAVKDKYPKE